MARHEARYPYEAAITSYGNGGFRFADMSHRGSVLCLPSGIYAWDAVSGEALRADDFEFALSQLAPPCVLLIGTGTQQHFMSAEVEKRFLEAGVGLEVMSTGAAARTYAIMLGEKRSVAAALIAVP